MATVDEPCADFKMAAMIKGNSTPKVLSEAPKSLMISTNPLSTITLPSTLPAAVMKMMGPAVMSDFCVMS